MAAPVALVTLVVSSGCSPADQGGIALDPESGRPRLELALCDGETVEAVELRTPVTGDWTDRDSAVRTLWRIEADVPRRRASFVVGTVPEGFAEVVPLLTEDLPEELSLTAEMAGDGIAATHGGAFDLVASALVYVGLLVRVVRRGRRVRRELAGTRAPPP